VKIGPVDTKIALLKVKKKKKLTQAKYIALNLANLPSGLKKILPNLLTILPNFG